jgi:hypothetical protein
MYSHHVLVSRQRRYSYIHKKLDTIKDTCYWAQLQANSPQSVVGRARASVLSPRGANPAHPPRNMILYTDDHSSTRVKLNPSDDSNTMPTWGGARGCSFENVPVCTHSPFSHTDNSQHLVRNEAHHVGYHIFNDPGRHAEYALIISVSLCSWT